MCYVVVDGEAVDTRVPKLVSARPWWRRYRSALVSIEESSLLLSQSSCILSEDALGQCLLGRDIYVTRHDLFPEIRQDHSHQGKSAAFSMRSGAVDAGHMSSRLGLMRNPAEYCKVLGWSWSPSDLGANKSAKHKSEHANRVRNEGIQAFPSKMELWILHMQCSMQTPLPEWLQVHS